MKRLSGRSGMTLMELLIAVFVLSVGIVSTLLFFSSAMLSADYAGDITSASTHTEHVLEEMRSRNSLKDITLTDWDSWAQKDALYTLPEENLSVAYTNADADPLEVTVEVGWTKRSRAHKMTMYTTILK